MTRLMGAESPQDITGFHAGVSLELLVLLTVRGMMKKRTSLCSFRPATYSLCITYTMYEALYGRYLSSDALSLL